MDEKPSDKITVASFISSKVSGFFLDSADFVTETRIGYLAER
jgi:hypothetical protein